MQGSDTYHSQHDLSNSKVLNNRYIKVSKLGEGSYGTVFLAVDTKPQGTKRRVDAKYLDLLERVEEPKLNEEGEPAEKSAYTVEERKEAIDTLGNRELLFSQNDLFANSTEN